VILVARYCPLWTQHVVVQSYGLAYSLHNIDKHNH